MNDQYIMIPASDFVSQISEIVATKVSEAISQINQKNEAEKLISAKEACKLFQPNITRQTLHTWTKEGKIQARYTGKRVFYLKSEVLEVAKSIKKYGRS